MKNIPQRMCCICRKTYPKKELLRLVKIPEGLAVDFAGKAEGRGTYICCKPECLVKCKRTKILKKLLGVEPSEELLNNIEQALSQKAAEKHDRM